MTIEDIPTWLKAITGTVAGIWAAWKTVIKPLSEYVKIKNARNKALETLLHELPFIKMAAMRSLEKIQVYWYRADSSGYTIEVSPQLCALLGYSDEELKKEGWLSYVVPVERLNMKNEMVECVKSYRDFRMPATFIHRDGTKHRYFVSAEHDKFSGWLGEIKPIEKRAA